MLGDPVGHRVNLAIPYNENSIIAEQECRHVESSGSAKPECPTRQYLVQFPVDVGMTADVPFAIGYQHGLDHPERSGIGPVVLPENCRVLAQQFHQSRVLPFLGRGSYLLCLLYGSRKNFELK